MDTFITLHGLSITLEYLSPHFGIKVLGVVVEQPATNNKEALSFRVD
jgi:hypothetical protein